jgi:Tfp pilus assembly protein PilN
MKPLFLSALTAVLLCGSAMAQAPIIVQPANQTAPAQTAKTQAASDDSDVQAAIKSLEEMKAANEELLKKQQATLDALDQLQKDAEQLRIFAKRG